MNKSQLLYLFSQGLIALFNWLLLITLAQKFSKELLGEYSLILAYLTPLVLLYALQMKSHYLTNNKYPLKDYISLRLILFIPLFLLISIIGTVKVSFYIVLGVLFLKISDLIQEISFMKKQKEDELMKGSVDFIVKILMSYIVIFLLIYFKFDLKTSLLVGGGTGLFISLLYLMQHLSDFKFNFNKKLFLNLLPFGASSFILSFALMIPRFIIENTLGLEDLALYTVTFTFYGIWQLFFNNYFNGILEKMKSLSVFQRTSVPMTFFILCSFVFLCFDKEIYTILFGLEYALASKYSVLLILNIFLSFISSYFYFDRVSKMDYKSHFVVNSINLLLTFFVNINLISDYHLYGAFMAQGLSLLSQCSLYIILGRKA